MTSAEYKAAPQALDSIRITGITATGFHGVLQSERETGQEFIADLTLGVNLAQRP